MKLKVLLNAALCILIAMAFGGWADNRFADQDYEYENFEERFEADLGGIDTVELTIVNGSIDVLTWSDDKVSIEMHEKVRVNDDIDTRVLADEIKLVDRREGSKLIIEIDYGTIEKNHRKYYSGSIDMKLPARLSLNLETVNGGVTVDEINGNLRIDTTNGAIDADGCGSNAYVETTNGDVTVGLIRGKTEADTTNGNITLEGIGGPVKGGTTNGNITVDLKEDLRGDVSLETTNGNITFTCGPGSGFELDAETTNGRVYGPESERFIGEYDRKHRYLKGTFGGGGHKVYIENTNGSIRINIR